MDKEKYRTVKSLFQDRVIWKLLAMVKKYKWMYVVSITCQIALTGVALLFAETTRRLFDMAPNIPGSTLKLLITAFILFTIMRITFTFLAEWFQSLLNESVVFEMRSNILNHIQRLPLGFHENNHSSKAINIMHHELEIAKDFIVSDIQKLIILPISFIFVGIYLLTVHPLLGVIGMALGPLQLLSNLVYKEKFKYASKMQSQVTRDAFFRMGETLQGIREVKANQLEEQIYLKMKDVQHKDVLYNVLLTKVRTIRNISRDIPMQGGYILGIGLGAVLMTQGSIGVGGLVAFITLLERVSVPFTTVVGVINNLQHASAGASRLFDVLAMQQEDTETGIPFTAGSANPPSITFNQVNFNYLEGHTTINDVSFNIPSGKSIALVGPSGSGKSTIIKLLFGFYTPHKGAILLDKQPMNNYSMNTVRQNMALVSQDIFLFDATIAENIAVGCLDANREDIEQAARFAEAYEFISELPNGFDSEIGERGIKLSHGQKQRISIARAILRKASILILDEPTSALDVETEASFQQNLGKWAEQCTKVIIAHRLSTIRDADYIVFLDEGKIVEAGTPAQLLSSKGRFHRYWVNQGAGQYTA